MKKGWVIYSRETLSSKFQNNAFDWMVESAKKFDLEVQILFEEDFVLETDQAEQKFYINGHGVEKPDFALMRSYAFDIARHLEAGGIPVFNGSESMSKSQDKWRTHQILSGLGIPSPKSVLGNMHSEYKAIVEALGSPFVLKGLFGSKGEEVFLIESEHSYYEIKKKLGQARLLFQAFIAESAGTDIRVHVVDDQIVAAVRRRSGGDFKSNFHQGGSADRVELTDEMIRVAKQAAKALDLGFAGIDLLESNGGVLVCEVNAIPGFRTVCITSDADIPTLLFEHVHKALTSK